MNLNVIDSVVQILRYRPFARVVSNVTRRQTFCNCQDLIARIVQKGKFNSQIIAVRHNATPHPDNGIRIAGSPGVVALR